jgi:hypothetical protein
MRVAFLALAQSGSPPELPPLQDVGGSPDAGSGKA